VPDYVQKRRTFQGTSLIDDASGDSPDKAG
jgi:hypothetical protein